MQSSSISPTSGSETCSFAHALPSLYSASDLYVSVVTSAVTWPWQERSDGSTAM